MLLKRIPHFLAVVVLAIVVIASGVCSASQMKITCHRVETGSAEPPCQLFFPGLQWMQPMTIEWFDDTGMTMLSDELVLFNKPNGARMTFASDLESGLPLIPPVGPVTQIVETDNATLTITGQLLSMGVPAGNLQLVIQTGPTKKWSDIVTETLGPIGIPEPRTAGLIGLALVGFAASRFLRKIRFYRTR